MTRNLVIALIALSLAACATPSVRDESPPSDLDALVIAVERDLQPRTLPNGKAYCAEDARTEGEQDECLADVEALNIQGNADKARARATLRSGVNRLKAARLQCSWWQFRCKALREVLQQGRQPP